MGFSIKDVLYNKASSLIHLETEPGLGCTESACVQQWLPQLWTAKTLKQFP